MHVRVCVCMCVCVFARVTAEVNSHEYAGRFQRICALQNDDVCVGPRIAVDQNRPRY